MDGLILSPSGHEVVYSQQQRRQFQTRQQSVPFHVLCRRVGHDEWSIKSVIGIVIIFLAFVVTKTEGAWGQQSGPLYSPEDKVVILNATSIKNHIYHSPKAWVVEFYSSWCGHCIQFAPKWKQFALDLESWRNVVAIAGIDCADDTNTAVCREFDIMGYPTILIYEPNSPATKEIPDDDENKDKNDKKVMTTVTNRGNALPRTGTMGEMKKELIDALGPMFPDLLAPIDDIPVTDENQFWQAPQPHLGLNGAGQQQEHILFLYESNTSYIGREVALRLSSLPQVRVARFIRKNPLYSKLNLEGFPAAAYLRKGDQPQIINMATNEELTNLLHSAVLRLAGFVHAGEPLQLLPPKNDVPAVVQVNNEVSSTSSSAVALSPNADVVSIEDLVHAVRNSLFNEIGMPSKISGPKLEALLNYMEILTRYFPYDSNNFKAFLAKLHTWIRSQQEIKSKLYLDKLTELEIEFQPFDIDTKTWGTCKGSIPGRRGYPCSLWRLFHTLTVIAMEKHENFEVLNAIHGYVKEFFGCRDCADHFIGMVAQDNALHITSVSDQAIWLWKAHNKVNIRLKGSLSEDPSSPKHLYPTKYQCYACYVGPGHFDEKEVTNYLIKVYTNPKRTESNNGASVDQAIKPLNLVKNDNWVAQEEYGPNSNRADSSQERQRKHSEFSILDIGIFIVVYGTIVLILGYVYVKLVARRWIDPVVMCRRVLSSRSVAFP